MSIFKHLFNLFRTNKDIPNPRPKPKPRPGVGPLKEGLEKSNVKKNPPWKKIAPPPPSPEPHSEIVNNRIEFADKVRKDLEKGEITINQARVKFGLKPIPEFDIASTLPDTNQMFNDMMAITNNRLEIQGDCIILHTPTFEETKAVIALNS